jgi:hypothetical protein
MGLAAPWALQLDDELAGFDLVHEIRKSPVTSGASHLSLENVHRRALPVSCQHMRPPDGAETVRASRPRINPSKDGFFFR